MGRSLTRRAMWAGGAVALVVGAVLSVPLLASAEPAPVPAAEAPAPGTHAQHAAAAEHAAQMLDVAEAQGLERAPGGGRCGDGFQFQTRRGLHCTAGPMLEHMFTPAQLAGAALPAADAKVGCVGDGTSGKRLQLVYARRSNTADRYAATATKMRSWATTIDQTMQSSATKTGGSRRVRWATDANCSATVLDVTVASNVTSFSELVDALEAINLTSTSRKYLVAWDDSDLTDAFCGLGQSYPDATAGPTNRNETQPGGAMFAAVQPNCWTGSVAAHEVMHTLGAVQAGAPHASRYGHCTDESDLMCYVDGAGTVLSQVCPTSQESLYDCNNDDYFHTNPPRGNYLFDHWNSASSGWLELSAPPQPGYAPFASWAALVARQHVDVLGRNPTSAESNSWVAQLEAGTKTRSGLVDALRRSSENTTNVDPTVRLYRAFLGRAPDAGGLEFWIGRRRSGAWSLTKMADSFATSSEFTRKYGALTNRAFVTRIYTDVLGRTADPSGVDYWTLKLDTKSRTRGGVMVGFSESGEYKRKQAQNTDVSVAYVFLLDRAPNAAEITTWVDRQTSGVSHPTLVEELLASAAYAARVSR